MSNYYHITSDRINGKEKKYINRLAKALKKNGHKVSIGVVNPNGVQSYGSESKSKGKIGIQIIGGRCGWTASDCAVGVKKGYYHYDQIILCGCYEFTKNKNISSSAMDTKMVRPHDAGNTLKDMYVGKTPNQFNKQYGKYCKFVLSDTWDEMVKGVLGDNLVDKKSNGGNGSTYLESIKDLIKVWDGDVSLKIDNGKVYINKIQEPNPSLFAKEGVNIISGSLTLQDYNPNTVNKLVTNYDGKKITITDDYLINRFGEKSSSVDATEIVTVYTEEPVETSDNAGGTVTTGTTSTGGGSTNTASSNSKTAKSKSWTEISNIVNKYYPNRSDKDTIIRRFNNAKNNWSNISRITNSLGGDSGLQNAVIRAVMKAKKG